MLKPLQKRQKDFEDVYKVNVFCCKLDSYLFAIFAKKEAML
jgi:hypothetical protein